MRTREWTASDDEDLHRLVGEGFMDIEIAKSTGWARRTIGRHRRRLGIAPAKRKYPGGWKHSEQSLANCRAAQRKYWANCGRFRRPPKGTEEARRYAKMRDVLGVAAARAALVQSPTAAGG